MQVSVGMERIMWTSCKHKCFCTKRCPVKTLIRASFLERCGLHIVVVAKWLKRGMGDFAIRNSN